MGENKRRGTLLTVRDPPRWATILFQHAILATHVLFFCFRRENKNDILDLMNYCSRLPLVRTGDLFFPTIFLFNTENVFFLIVNWTTFAKNWGKFEPIFCITMFLKEK
jgi:hypothetical protein